MTATTLLLVVAAWVGALATAARATVAVLTFLRESSERDKAIKATERGNQDT